MGFILNYVQQLTGRNEIKHDKIERWFTRLKKKKKKKGVTQAGITDFFQELFSYKDTNFMTPLHSMSSLCSKNLPYSLKTLKGWWQHVLCVKKVKLHFQRVLIKARQPFERVKRHPASDK